MGLRRLSSWSRRSASWNSCSSSQDSVSRSASWTKSVGRRATSRAASGRQKTGWGDCLRCGGSERPVADANGLPRISAEARVFHTLLDSVPPAEFDCVCTRSRCTRGKSLCQRRWPLIKVQVCLMAIFNLKLGLLHQHWISGSKLGLLHQHWISGSNWR